jgi:thymidylate synthase (FAD)
MDLLKKDAEQVYDHYIEMLNENEAGQILDEKKSGLARELARMNLTVNFYTQWYWKVDLHNFMNFISLRADAHAQYEIRVYAEAMLDVFKRWLPLCHEAFSYYRIGGASISAKGLTVIKRLIAGEAVSQETSGMSKGEWNELQAVLKN